MVLPAAAVVVSSPANVGTLSGIEDTVSIARPGLETTASSVVDWLWAPVLRGPLAGLVWRLNSRGKVARVIMGSYEKEQTEAFCDLVKPGDVMLDIGAATGYYTLLSSLLVGSRGRVISFEPEPRNLKTLKSHVQVNNLKQVTIRNHALGGENGLLRFGGGSGSGTSRLCADGEIEVEVRVLDEVVRELQVAPTHMKIDVEGAEYSLLKGAEQTIARHRPTIFLSTHPTIVDGVHQACCHLLESWNYALEPLIGRDCDNTTELVAKPRS